MRIKDPQIIPETKAFNDFYCDIYVSDLVLVTKVHSGQSELSLVPCPRMPPGEKRSGELSRIPWACDPKWVMTNEIARLVIIT